jgi:hypothetical protein
MTCKKGLIHQCKPIIPPHNTFGCGAIQGCTRTAYPDGH